MKSIVITLVLVLVSALAVVNAFDMLRIVDETTDFDAKYIEAYESNWEGIQQTGTWLVNDTVYKKSEEKELTLLDSLIAYVYSLFEGIL